jgi:hypothetical protein
MRNLFVRAFKRYGELEPLILGICTEAGLTCQNLHNRKIAVCGAGHHAVRPDNLHSKPAVWPVLTDSSLRTSLFFGRRNIMAIGKNYNRVDVSTPLSA